MGRKVDRRRILAGRYGLTAHHYDYHDARGHQDRRIARRVRLGQPLADPDPEAVWVDTAPEVMAAGVLAGFPERFEWALDDLRALVAGRPILAEGWLRPELVVPSIAPRDRLVALDAVHAARAIGSAHDTGRGRRAARRGAGG